jgi:hypothetical protein
MCASYRSSAAAIPTVSAVPGLTRSGHFAAPPAGRPSIYGSMARVADCSVRGLGQCVFTGIESGRRRGTAVALLPLLIVATFVMGARSFRGCDSTKLAVTPIDRSGLDGPVTLEAQLTSGGDPVRGAAISFLVLSDGPMTTSKGRVIGAVDTDADGFARLSFSRGLAALEPPYYLINGDSAEFRFTGSVPGREGDLCRAEGRLVFT